MAFPAIAASNSGTATTGSQTVNLPAGITAGDKLLAIISSANIQAYTWPAGWTELFDVNSSLGFSAAYRNADGSEGASITVTAGNAFTSAYITRRITGAHTAAPEAAFATPSVSANPNPPSVTPSWGADDDLWIVAAVSAVSVTINVSSYPTNYSSDQLAVDPGSNSLLASASRQLNATSEDPGTFTFSGSNTVSACTIAIRPAAGGKSPPFQNFNPMTPFLAR